MTPALGVGDLVKHQGVPEHLGVILEIEEPPPDMWATTSSRLWSCGMICPARAGTPSPVSCPCNRMGTVV